MDISLIYAKVEKAQNLAERIWGLRKLDYKKTLVVKFPRSYFVFTVGQNEFRAYPLSTTRYKVFSGCQALYKFLFEKDIQEVYDFKGDLSPAEIKERLKELESK